ncbi:MAG: helix-turn-helix domain-containing protein [Rhizobiaceae bacterium]
MASERVPPSDHETDAGVFFARRPEPLLAPWVERILGYEERGSGLDGSTEAASFVVPLVIGFGEDFRIGLARTPTVDDRHGSFASGLYPGPVVISSTGRAACVQIDFTPLGAQRFFRVSMPDMAGRLVHLADLDDRGVADLKSQLGDTAAWTDRLDHVESFLMHRLAAIETRQDELAWAYATIRASGGSARIEHLATRIGWSRKHFSRRFTESFGLRPKTVARMARFHAALGMVGGPDVDWADIAFACGYADQSHLTRDFAEFAGLPPARWLARAA